MCTQGIQEGLKEYFAFSTSFFFRGGSGREKISIFSEERDSLRVGYASNPQICKKKMGENLESVRKRTDVIYRLTDRSELDDLWHHVNGIQCYLKQVYGNSFERLPEIIGDREQRAPCENPVLVEVLDRVLAEKQYDILLLAFLLFLSFLKDMQVRISGEVLHKDAYYDWLRGLYDRSCRFLEGTGDPVDGYLSTTCVQYVTRTPLFITSHREQSMLEGHRE